VTKPALDCSGIVTSIREGEPASTAKHVGVELDIEAGASTLDQSAKACGREWRTSLADKGKQAIHAFTLNAVCGVHHLVSDA
jgi:hypothetical protein